MVSFKFVSERGSIAINSGNYVYSSCEGVNGADSTMQTNTFFNTDGAEYDNILFDVPTTTVKGYIRADNTTHFNDLQANLFKIINGKEKGILYYNNGQREYFTEVLPLLPQVGARTQNYASFVLYFRRYNVYWKLNRICKYDIYTVTNCLKTTFALPCVFSERVNTCKAVNYGDIDAQPIITVKGIGQSTETSAQHGIVIKNNTSGKTLTLAYDVAEDETITFDVAKCTVTSNVSGNIINRLTAVSDFFTLLPGINEIEVINKHTENEVAAHMSFYCPVLGV